MAGQSADGRPRVGQSIEVHEADGKSSIGRVQTSDDGHIVVAVSTDAGIAVHADPGALFDLVWPGSGGVSILPVALARRHGASQIELWEFDAAGAARFEQRRLQARIAASGPIELLDLQDSSSEPLALAGALIDVSEAALQCVLDISPGDPVLISGTPVRCRFSLHGTAFDLHGTVHAAWTSEPPPRLRVVVRFDPGETDLPALAELLHAAA